MGFRGAILKFAAVVMSPLAVIARERLGHYEPMTARKVEAPGTAALAEVFFRYSDYYKRNHIITTYRDTNFIEWRYGACPYRSQLVFYLAGQSEPPSHVLIARVMHSRLGKEVRILDVFGDLDNRTGLRDILRLAVRDAMCQGAYRVTAMTSLPVLRSVLPSIGFLYSKKIAFCWHAQSQDLMRVFGESTCHWALADSNMDEPV
jgi:hypothetical protein